MGAFAWEAPPLDERKTYAVRLQAGGAWLQCQHCLGTFARDSEAIQKSQGESMGCPRCAMIQIIGAPE